MAEWVRVTFYAKINPDKVDDFDLLRVGEKLGEAVAAEYVDNIVIERAER